MSFSAKTKFVTLSALTIVALSILIVVLVTTLSVSPLENGGSPEGPPRIDFDVENNENENEFIATTESPEDKSPHGQYRYAAVAADVNPCSTVGVDVLAKLQGSATDAAIATMLCVGLVHCHASGIGGGHFTTIYDRPNNGSNDMIFNTIISRGRAPLNATEDMFINVSYTSTEGGMSLTVPGEIKGYYRAWQKFGRVPWPDLFKPTIDLCVNGHLVTPALSKAIRQYGPQIRADPNLGELFLKEDGTLVQEGDILYRPKMAKTLQIIADDPEAFYNPESQLAQDIIADIQDYGGIISLEDLSIFEVYDKDPVKITLDNGQYTVYGPRPPSSGAVLQYILNILDGYNFNAGDISESEKKVLTYHRITEAYKFAYAKRSQLGDEEFVEGIEEIIKNLTSSHYADATRRMINDTMTQGVMFYEPDFDVSEDQGTSHINVLAADGSAAAITSSINFYFGSNIRGNRTGIFFNNGMDDFSTPGTTNGFGVPASPSNYIVPYKMPMSSMSPTLIADKDGKIRFVSGASGGTRITTTIAYVAMHTLWFGMPVNEATDLKRMHHQLMPNEVRHEPGFDEEVYEGLQQKGHEMDRTNKIAVVQSIHNKCKEDSGTDLCIHAVSDVRKDGTPDGY